MNIIIEQLGEDITPHVQGLLPLLPQIWQAFSAHLLFTCAAANLAFVAAAAHHLQQGLAAGHEQRLACRTEGATASSSRQLAAASLQGRHQHPSMVERPAQHTSSCGVKSLPANSPAGCQLCGSHSV